MSVGGGIDWESAYRPLAEVGAFPATVYLFFILFASFCVMNVIIGIFCQNAMEAFEQDKEQIQDNAMKERKMHVATLKELFAKWDHGGDGEISKDEFEAHLEDPNMHALLRRLDIDRRDALTLFSLLDGDGSGGLDVDEFICGCITFKGAAKAIQIEKTALELRNLLNRFEQLEETTDDVHRLCKSAGMNEASLGSKPNLYPLGENTVSLPNFATECEEC